MTIQPVAWRLTDQSINRLDLTSRNLWVKWVTHFEVNIARGHASAKLDAAAIRGVKRGVKRGVMLWAVRFQRKTNKHRHMGNWGSRVGGILAAATLPYYYNTNITVPLKNIGLT